MPPRIAPISVAVLSLLALAGCQVMSLPPPDRASRPVGVVGDACGPLPRLAHSGLEDRLALIAPVHQKFARLGQQAFDGVILAEGFRQAAAAEPISPARLATLRDALAHARADAAAALIELAAVRQAPEALGDVDGVYDRLADRMRTAARASELAAKGAIAVIDGNSTTLAGFDLPDSVRIRPARRSHLSKRARLVASEEARAAVEGRPPISKPDQIKSMIRLFHQAMMPARASANANLKRLIYAIREEKTDLGLELGFICVDQAAALAFLAAHDKATGGAAWPIYAEQAMRSLQAWQALAQADMAVAGAAAVGLGAAAPARAHLVQAAEQVAAQVGYLAGELADLHVNRDGFDALANAHLAFEQAHADFMEAVGRAAASREQVARLQ